MTSGRRPRVLVVLAEPPLAEGGAAGRTAVGLLRGLALHGVDVRAVAAQRSWDHGGRPPDDLDVELVPADRTTGWRRRQLERLRRPVGELSYGPFEERVQQLARGADVLHLEEVGTSWCGRGSGVPSLVHLHYLVRRDRDPGPPWRPAFREVMEAHAAEHAALRQHRVVVASSPVVAAELRRRRPSAEVVHVPLALDVDERPDGAPKEARAGVIGTAAWPPTRDALARLLGSIWPAVHARVPEARLDLAGRGLLDVVRVPLPAGAHLRGEVRSAHEFLRSLSVLIYPVRRGSGMKVKVMESLACGVPVITTPEGAEGIEPGPAVLVADTDAELVEHAVRLLSSPADRAAAAQAARRCFAEHYAPAAATRALLPVYDRLATSRW